MCGVLVCWLAEHCGPTVGPAGALLAWPVGTEVLSGPALSHPLLHTCVVGDFLYNFSLLGGPSLVPRPSLSLSFEVTYFGGRK